MPVIQCYFNKDMLATKSKIKQMEVTDICPVLTFSYYWKLILLKPVTSPVLTKHTNIEL